MSAFALALTLIGGLTFGYGAWMARTGDEESVLLGRAVMTIVILFGLFFVTLDLIGVSLSN